MLTIKINEPYKSIKEVCKFELPDFTVITGKNGSGKTHLLETLSSKAVIYHNGQQIKNKLYIPYNLLIPQIDDFCNDDTIKGFIKSTWEVFHTIIVSMQRYTTDHGEHMPVDVTEEGVLSSITQSNQKDFVRSVIRKSGKPIENITQDDFIEWCESLDYNYRPLFHASFALVFRNYHRKDIHNKFNRFLASEGKKTTYLSDEAFTERHGTPPWLLVNDILDEADIPYQVTYPDPDDLTMEIDFFFKLVDKEHRFEIKTEDLSTGEKILMSLALAIYNADNAYSQKPDLLLIDEPDAPLHPSMTKKMIDIIKKYIVGKSGIPTIITTHSPMTVIASEGVDLYEMQRGNSIPQKISTQQAVEILSNGIPFLKISTEKRRQVFVESNNDVNYYEQIANILGRRELLPSEPIFIQARTTSGCNCQDVIAVVSGLYKSGNDQIYGIIDWDSKNSSNNRIIVLGENSRYAIENYLLDPLLMGLLFIRESYLKPDKLGLSSIKSYSDIANMTQVEAQTIIDMILAKLGLSGTPQEYSLYNGWKLEISREFAHHQGHELEQKYKNEHPFLRIYRKEADLKNDIIQKVVNDYPDFTPNEIFDPIRKIR